MESDLAEKYFATYAAACVLEILVESIEAGFPPKVGGPLMEDAKNRLLELRRLESGRDSFFGRFST